MALTPVSSSNSDSSNLNQINDMVRQLNNESQTKVFKGPNNVNALITGKLPNDIGYGFQFSDSDNVPRIIGYIDANNNPIFKISESGVDVTTATDDQLNFNSTQNTFKIVSTGTVTVDKAANDSFESTSIAHGLDYIPAMICYIRYDTGGGVYTQIPTPLYTLTDNGAGALDVTRAITATIDTTNINFSISTPNTGSTYTNAYSATFRYYLLQETAN